MRKGASGKARRLGPQERVRPIGAIGQAGSFDDRDGQFLTGFSLSGQIPAGLGASNYLVTSVRLTLSLNFSAADLVIWEHREFELRNTQLHHAVDHTPYEGMTLKAWPGVTIARGEVIWDGQAFHARAGQGHFLKRGAPTLWPRAVGPSA